MVTNNIEADVKVKCIEKGINQQQLGEAIGSTGQYISRVIRNKEGYVNRTLVKAFEALGYDITLTYTPHTPEPTKSKPDLDALLDD